MITKQKYHEVDELVTNLSCSCLAILSFSNRLQSFDYIIILWILDGVHPNTEHLSLLRGMSWAASLIV